MIMPNGNTTISVECIPESDVPRKFEEVNIFILNPEKNLNWPTTEVFYQFSGLIKKTSDV